MINATCTVIDLFIYPRLALYTEFNIWYINAADIRATEFFLKVSAIMPRILYSFVICLDTHQ